MSDERIGACLLAWAVCMVACARGESDLPEPPTLESGLYELTTIGIDPACPVLDAITPGAEYVGKLARVLVEPHNDAIEVEVCDRFFEDQCVASFEAHHTWSALQTGSDLIASATPWSPSCCFDSVEGTRSMTGEIIDDGEAELTWTIATPAMPLNCSCEAMVPCTGDVRQLLSRRD